MHSCVFSAGGLINQEHLFNRQFGQTWGRATEHLDQNQFINNFLTSGEADLTDYEQEIHKS